MRPKRHIERLLRWMTKIREEVVTMKQEGHINECGYKGLDEIERDIEIVVSEASRKELLKGK